MSKGRIMYHAIVSVGMWAGFWTWLTESLEVGFWMSLVGIISAELIYAIMKSFDEMF